MVVRRSVSTALCGVFALVHAGAAIAEASPPRGHDDAAVDGDDDLEMPASSNAPATPPEPAAHQNAQAALPQVAEGRRRALVMDLRPEGVDEHTARTLSDIVATAVGRDPTLAVTSGADLRSLLDIEATLQMTGCDEALEACMVEIGGALGADLVVSGSVGRLGSTLVVTLSIYDVIEQASIAREKVEAEKLQELSPKIDAAVARALGIDEPASTAAVSPMMLSGAVLGLSSGIAAVSAGAGAAWSFGLQSDPKSLGEEKALAESLWPFLVGAVVVSAGGLAVAAGLATTAMVLE